MKKILILFCFVWIISCDSGSFNNNNPYLPNYTVNLPINLSYPQYSNLRFASNYIVEPSQGVRGIVVFNTGSGYNAFDLGCPNQPLSSCSTLTISGIDATCPCDEAVYGLFNGQSPGKQYPLKQYRVQVNGDDTLLVYN